MSTIADFNRIEDCNKIDPLCVDAYSDLTIDGTKITSSTPWGTDTIDIKNPIIDNQSLTKLSLSPDTAPNCLVYEPEYGENDCIHGDDLSEIISMSKLKDVASSPQISDGDIYIYSGGAFVPFDITTALYNINSAITNINASISNLSNRTATLENTATDHATRIQTLEGKVQTIETTLTKPTGAPVDSKVVWGNINVYADTNAVVDSGGTATTLDKTHGLYTHDTSTNAYGDELFS